MDRILKGPRASSAPALELNTIIFKHVYWYMQQISGERLQDHWSSGCITRWFPALEKSILEKQVTRTPLTFEVRGVLVTYFSNIDFCKQKTSR